jgi:acyl-CoA synthetase (AMP-forming)/AMP-acid ligase II
MYKVPPVRSVDTLPQLLSSAAATSGRCIFYSAGEDGNLLSESTSYAELLMEAAEKASRIASIPGLAPDSVLLLHFASQRENIVWFWAVTLAGFLPTISTALVKDDDQRKAHLERLHTLLRSPTFITSKRLAAEFQGVPQLTIQYIETLDSVSAGDPISNLSQLNKTARDVAVLMLTSGSTGGAKAVPLRHGQIIKSLEGKSSHHGTAPGHVFLNWVGLDHVASLLEIHLHSSTYVLIEC